DLHPENVLAAAREPWLVIDPKPYVGDPAYDPLQHMLNFPDRLGADPLGFVRRMAGLLDLDPDRLRQWTFARCVQESADQPELRAAAVRLAPRMQWRTEHERAADVRNRGHTGTTRILRTSGEPGAGPPLSRPRGDPVGEFPRSASAGTLYPMRGRTQDDGSTPRDSRHDYWGVVLDAPDALALARFYSDLLGWEIAKSGPEDAAILPPDGVAYLGFQTSPEYVRPVWPAAAGSQQMMLHLDLEVEDLDAAVAHAVELGAEIAEYQPQDDVRVLLDPAGHPFCLYLG
ncbi:MAG: hypothetical protein GEU93_21615, partial [Propionibacteriales bacterium]|nr:hypothetical protein [Propionibacteriales bacterium]